MPITLLGCPSQPSTTVTCNWVVPAGVCSVVVEMWAGGGGGQANIGCCSCEAGINGQPGGGGGYGIRTLAVCPGQQLQFSIGAGGTPGANYCCSGGMGGNTTMIDPAGCTTTICGGYGGCGQGQQCGNVCSQTALSGECGSGGYSYSGPVDMFFAGGNAANTYHVGYNGRQKFGGPAGGPGGGAGGFMANCSPSGASIFTSCNMSQGKFPGGGASGAMHCDCTCSIGCAGNGANGAVKITW